MPTTGPFGLADAGVGAAVSDRGVQGTWVDTRISGVPVDDCLVVDVFT
jgi:hypothetical protein